MNDDARQRSLRNSFFKRYLSIILTITIGSILAVTSFCLLRSWEHKQLESEFQHFASNHAQALKQSGEVKIRILESIRTFYKSSQVVERDEFREFTRPFANMADIQAIEWIPRVRHIDRLRFESDARAEGLENFRFTEREPSGKIIGAREREEYFPVYFLEPLAGNEAALGFDIASEPTRQDALYLARDTGKMIATERLTLVQEKGYSGVLIFLPIYQRNQPVDTVESRRQNLEGFILGVFRIAAFVEDALNIVGVHGIALQFSDLSADADNRLLYYYPKDSPTQTSIDNMTIPRSLQKLQNSVIFETANRRWSVESIPTADFAQRYLTLWPYATLIIILLITGLVALTFYLNVNRRKIIELEVDRRTEELKDSQTRFRAIFDQTFQFIGLMKTDGTLIEANRSSLKFAGFKESDVLGKLFWETPWWEHSAEQQKKLQDAVKTAAAGEFVRFEANSCTSEGKIIDVDFSLKPVLDENGKVCLLIPEGHNITDRKQAEREREQLLKILEAKNKELQSIVYVASHDLKSPLVNLQGFSGELEKNCQQLETLLESEEMPEALKNQLHPILHEEIPESLQFIQKSTMKMGTLLKGLLRISRVGTVELSIVVLDMDLMLKAVLGAMEYQIQQKDVSVTLEKLPRCLGDGGQIDQVFTNLIDNALKYMDPARKGVLKISGKVENGMSIYCVQDNGIGIDPQHAKKVFELFHRLNPQEPVEGEGLGLTIISRILDRNNGKIRMESEPDKGSSFFVALPTA